MTEFTAASSTQSKTPAPAKAGVGRFKRNALLMHAVIAVISLTASVGIVSAHGNGLELGVADASEMPAHSNAGSVGYAYRDGPPPGFSGGLGEDNCQACHFAEKGEGINASPGKLTITAPGRYVPGRTYSLTVALTRPGMMIGGFQLTARFEHDSAQAGTLALAAGDEERIKVMIDRGVQYAHHRQEGTRLTAPGTVRWTLRWTAPAERRSVMFSVAANAANADESQFGDFIYTASVRSRGH